MDDGGDAGQSSKVERVADRYGLDGLGEELEHRWTAPRDQRDSLRALATYVNRRLVAAALREAGRSPTDAEVDGYYEALTDEEVDRGTRTRTRRDLERAGVDVDRLRAAFVTHQSVHSYLTEVRGASLETEPPTVEDETATIARLRGRTSAVTATTLDRLVAAGEITDRDYEPLVDVRVLCRDCGRASDVESLLADGGCDCDVAEDG